MKKITTLLMTSAVLSAFAANTDVFLDAHPDWMELHDKAVELAKKNMEKLDGWKTQMTCMPGIGIIWQWDSCYMALFAGYTPDDYNGLGNLDNLYKMQGKDGYISMAYTYATREPTWPGRINPPLYAWCEWLYARRTGDKSRLARAYDACSKFYAWLKANRTRKVNGLYWFEDAGSSGMDNSPRAGYFATHLDGCDACFIDLCCQQVLSARCLAKIAPLVGKADEAAEWTSEADQLAEKINRLMWSENTQFYHDVYIENNNKLAVKTAAAFWALVSGVATPQRAAALAGELSGCGLFAAKSGVASLSSDDPNYNPEGGYWLGGIWPPIQYMVCRGLRANGYRELAREIAKKHLDCMTAVMKNDKEHTIWECYSPEYDKPSTDKFGLPVRKDFVGWGGLGPLVMLVEDIIGLDIAALENKVVWHLSEPGRQGVKEIPFNGGTISLEANAISDGAFTVKVDGNRPFHLTVISKNGRGILDKDITPGKHEFLPKGDEL